MAKSVRVQILNDGAVESSTDIPIPDAAPPPVVVPPPPHPPPPPPPVVLEPLPEFIELPHDKIPVPGRLNVHVARSGGATSDPTTWSTGKVPGPGDRVRVQDDSMVILDGTLECDVLVVDGIFQVNQWSDTGLKVQTLFGMPSGTFACGVDMGPITGRFTCIFRPAAPDPADPGQYLGGLLWLGEWTTHGRAKTAWINPSLSSVPWEVGDEVIFHDTRQLTAKERPLGYTQTERLTLKGEGRFGYAVPAFPHVGGKTDDGVVDIPMRVANLTRNVVFRAEVPGTAHCQFFDHARVDIRFASFVGMGRTTNEKLDPKLNPIGRYPVHMHGVRNPFHIEGCVVDGGDAPHDRKWGITIHGSHFGVVKDNVILNVMGAGIMEEDVTRGNTIEGNFICQVGGIGGRADNEGGGSGRQGAGIYLSGGLNRVKGNYVANTSKNYAYLLNFRHREMAEVPIGPGSEDRERLDVNAAGFLEFSQNTAFACLDSLTVWHAGTRGQQPIPGSMPFVLADFTSVNHSHYGIFQYETSILTVIRYKTRGLVSGTEGATAYYGADYAAWDLLIVDADIQGQEMGLNLSNFGGPQVILNSKINATTGILTSTPWNSNRVTGMPERQVVVKNCTFASPVAGQPFVAIAREAFTPADLTFRKLNLVVLDTLKVESFQGKAGDSFQVYYEEQRPGFVVPETILDAKGVVRVLGAPESGLTNAQCWAKHKLAIAGAVAPAGAKPRAGVKGVVL